MIFGRNTTCDISKLSQRITILTYHLWYLCQISLPIILLPLQTAFIFVFARPRPGDSFFFRSKRMNFQWLAIGTPVWERCKSSVLNLLRFKTKFIYSFSILPTKDYKEFNYAFAVIGALRGHKDTRFIGATQIHFNH